MAFENQTRYNFIKSLFRDKLAHSKHANYQQAYQAYKIQQNYSTSIFFQATVGVVLILLMIVDGYLIVSEIYTKADGIYNILFFHILFFCLLLLNGGIIFINKNKSLKFRKYFYWWFVAIFLTWCTVLSMIELEGEKDTVVVLIGVASISISIIFDKKERCFIYGGAIALVLFTFYLMTTDPSSLFSSYANILSFLLLGFVVSTIKSKYHRDIFLKEKIIEEQKNTLAAQNVKLENLLEKLQESNTNLEWFAARAAHDLKAPLLTISGFSSVLLESRNAVYSEEEKELFGYIMNDCKTLQNLIEGLLKFSSAENDGIDISTVSLQDVLDKVIKLLNYSISKGQAEIIYENSFPDVAAQESLLEQLFLNLINNALKFSPKDQPILIKVFHENMEDGMIKVGIQDNGIGIAPENHASIFKVFNKLHGISKYEGSGIGLATCKKIVEGFGGDIWVESTLGNGATFYFTLKLATVSTAS